MSATTVDLGERSYLVHVGMGLLERLSDFMPQVSGGSAVLLTDDRVGRLYGNAAEKSLAGKFSRTVVITIPAGEPSKSLEAAGKVLERMAVERVRRGDLLVALGGGVVTDVGGFVASIYQRGIAFVNVPTNLLGQVDAAIGGKTGVNLRAGKNLAGTFHQPKAVICDVSVLKSLSDSDFRSGLAEVAKYGFCFEPSMLEQVVDVSPEKTELLEVLIAKSVEHKARLVEADEFDLGERNKLNYGHTLGHALEAYGGYEGWSHGEAISIGMVFAAALSEETHTAKTDLIDGHRSVLGAIGLPIQGKFEPERVKAFLHIDKKHSTSLSWVLLEDLGKTVIESNVDSRAIDAALQKVIMG